jgi:hypothetical protein
MAFRSVHRCLTPMIRTGIVYLKLTFPRTGGVRQVFASEHENRSP